MGSVEPKKTAVEYAEQILGVHEAYQAATYAHSDVESYGEQLVVLRFERRNIEEAIVEREFQIRNEERNKHPDMAVTRFDEHFKQARHMDTEVADLRSQLSARVHNIDNTEYLLESAKARLRMYGARMEELGGYLNYLAAAKNAEGR